MFLKNGVAKQNPACETYIVFFFIDKSFFENYSSVLGGTLPWVQPMI